jgi:hypothetical protein
VVAQELFMLIIFVVVSSLPFRLLFRCCWCLQRRTTGVFRNQLCRLRWRQIIIFIAIVYVVVILCDKVRNVLLFPSLVIGSLVAIVIVSMLWVSAVLAAFVSVSTLHDVDGLVRYVELSKHSRDLIQNNTGTNDGNDGNEGNDGNDGNDEHEDGGNGANDDDDDDASSRSILYRRDTAREKCLNCKRGPRSWYSANFGIRRGRWFFYSKLVFELLEWRFVCFCWFAFPCVSLCFLVFHFSVGINVFSFL